LKRKNSRLEKCGIPEEQLYQLQQQLIQKARAEQADAQALQVAELHQMLAERQQHSDATKSDGDAELDEDYDVE